MPESNSSSLKGIGVILMIISLITGVAAIITPMNNQIESNKSSQIEVENRINVQLDKLDEKLQIRINNVKDIAEKNSEMSSNYIERHEGNNARMDEKIKDLIKHVEILERKNEKIQEEILEFYKKGGSQ